MVFSSLIFLFLFLPIALLGYYLCTRSVKNYWLLLASLVFFAWGGVSYTALLIISIGINYAVGLRIQKNIATALGYRWLVTGIGINLLFLVVYKYAGFLVSNLNEVLGWLHLSPWKDPHILLPIGISFYTFHSISYLVDIYRKKAEAQRNIFDVSLYISMFSQLIAGPIIRYGDISNQLRGRKHSLEKFSSGVERFILGLAKKVLVANVLGQIADDTFNHELQSLNAVNAWLGIICYTLQIYYDFSGYSDMAIGLGRMFGFEFQENFNFPYISRSLREFWQRWHISLSTFFRDYVYIPLGGNRVKPFRMYFNLILVFFLTGFWHGANWAFVLWGLFHGTFLILERLWLGKILVKLWKPLSNAYLILVVMAGWVLFRTESISGTMQFWKALFRFQLSDEQSSFLLRHFDHEILVTLLVGIGGALGLFQYLNRVFQRVVSAKPGAFYAYIIHSISALLSAAVLIYCTLNLLAGTYNPFIYFRF